MMMWPIGGGIGREALDILKWVNSVQIFWESALVTAAGNDFTGREEPWWYRPEKYLKELHSIASSLFTVDWWKYITASKVFYCIKAHKGAPKLQPNQQLLKNQDIKIFWYCMLPKMPSWWSTSWSSCSGYHDQVIQMIAKTSDPGEQGKTNLAQTMISLAMQEGKFFKTSYEVSFIHPERWMSEKKVTSREGSAAPCTGVHACSFWFVLFSFLIVYVPVMFYHSVSSISQEEIFLIYSNTS